MKRFLVNLPVAAAVLIIAVLVCNPGGQAKPISDNKKVINVITDDMIDDGPIAVKESTPQAVKDVAEVKPLESYRPAPENNTNSEIAGLKTRLDKLERDVAQLRSPPKPSNGSTGGSGSTTAVNYNTVSQAAVAVQQEPLVQVCTKNGCKLVPASQAHLYQQSYQSNVRGNVRGIGVLRRMR